MTESHFHNLIIQSLRDGKNFSNGISLNMNILSYFSFFWQRGKV
jgi:hypothetical protein